MINAAGGSVLVVAAALYSKIYVLADEPIFCPEEWPVAGRHIVCPPRHLRRREFHSVDGCHSITHIGGPTLELVQWCVEESGFAMPTGW